MTSDATTPAAPADGAPFTGEELDHLDGRRVGRLATTRPDGTLQINPIRGHAEAIAEPTDAAAGSGAIIRIRPVRVLALALHPDDRDLDTSEVRVRARNT